MKDTPTAARRRRHKKEAQEAFLAYIAQGFPITRACKAVGRTRRTYDLWRREDPVFARKADAIRLGNSDPQFTEMGFVERRKLFFGHDTPVHHARMIAAMDRAEPDSITLVLAPPESGKTTLMVDRVNDTLALCPNRRVTFVSESQHLSRKFVGQVKMRMTDEVQFSGYIDTYGPFKPPDREQSKPWNADYMTVVKASHDEKDYSLEGLGIGSQLYGARIDDLYCDDIQSDRNLAQTDKILTYLRQTALTRLSRDQGKTIFTGTRVGPGDIYERLLEEDMVDHLLQIPALNEPISRADHYTVVGDRVVVNPELDPHLSYWPEVWSLYDLARRRRKVGEDVWWRVYMQEPQDFGALTFDEQSIRKCLDSSRIVGGGSPGVQTVLSVDPALGGWAGFVVASFDSEKFWILDCENLQRLTRTEELIEVIRRLAAQWRPRVVILEEDWQKSWHTDDRLRVIASALGFDIYPHQTRGNKSDKTIGVASMASSFITGDISIPYGDEASRTRMSGLLSELRKWRPDIPVRLLRQDLVMALWFAWKYWQQQRENLHIEPVRFWRPSWMLARR